MRKKSSKNSGRYSPRARPRRRTEGQLIETARTVKQKVVILQKSIRHTPMQKLQDPFIAILAARAVFRRSTRASGVMKHYNVRSDVVPVPTGQSSRKR